MQRQLVRPKRGLVGDVSVPDEIMPVQFFGRAATAAPERRLMFAILVDAIVQLERRGTEAAEEAQRWIGRVADGPCSFRSTCEAVGLEPARLARALLAWYASDEPHMLGSTRLLGMNTHRRMTVQLPVGRAAIGRDLRARP